MGLIELAGAAGILFATLAVGIVAHEFTHVLALRILGVTCELNLPPARHDAGVFGIGISQAWAAVVPRTIPPGISPWGLRLAAIAPIILAAPPLLVLTGVFPDPIETGNVYLVAATVAWLGCALPSPQDFSLFWYAEQVLEELGESGSPPDATCDRGPKVTDGGSLGKR